MSEVEAGAIAVRKKDAVPQSKARAPRYCSRRDGQTRYWIASGVLKRRPPERLAERRLRARESVSGLSTLLMIAGSAAAASVIGGLIALWRAPTTLFMSVALGFASGVLLATISFEMLPQSIERGSLAATLAGFLAGFGAVYALDLYVHRGRLAGPGSQQYERVERAYHRRWPRGAAAIAMGTGFVIILALTRLIRETGTAS